jgi:hypothetical protein
MKKIMKPYFILALALILTTNIFAQNKPISPRDYAAMFADFAE